MSDTRITQHTDAHGHEQTAVRTSGKFAEKGDREGAAAPLSMTTADDRDWGQVSEEMLAKYADGAVDGRSFSGMETAPGIWGIGGDDESDGGILLSPERNAEIPEAFRNEDGWYGNGETAVIVDLTFPEEGEEDSAFPDIARRHLKDHYPAEWEAMTGETLDPSESYRKRLFTPLTESAPFPDPRVPGNRIVEARNPVSGEVRSFSVGKYQLDSGSIELGRAHETSVLDEAELSTDSIPTVSGAELRAQHPEIGEGLADAIDKSKGVVARSFSPVLGHALRLSNGSRVQIDKSTWDAIDSVPTSSDVELMRAEDAVNKARDAYEKNPDSANRKAYSVRRAERDRRVTDEMKAESEDVRRRRERQASYTADNYTQKVAELKAEMTASDALARREELAVRGRELRAFGREHGLLRRTETTTKD